MHTMAPCALYLGMDVSKGYADLHLLDAELRVLAKGRYDDTAAGHAAVRRVVEQYVAVGTDTQLLAGVEASGGLERNWVRMLRAVDARVTVAVLNPLAVKRFLEQELHRSVTDAQSAAGIALYLARGMRLHTTVADPVFEGARELARCVQAATVRVTEVKNQLQSLLPRVHPDLVQYVRTSVPQWVLQVLERYPTAPALARARPAALARIDHVTPARAQVLITDARQSVAAQRDAHTGVMVAYLARSIRNESAELEGLKQALCASLQDDPAVRRMVSIPGIGVWAAVTLRLEIGAVERFPSAKALTAFAGLDPRIHQSGDGLRRMRISKCGRRGIRAILYMCALSAMRCNPVIRTFYDRLRAAGKPHLVAMTACMRKLLHLAYACWIQDRDFDPDRALRRDNPNGEALPESAAPTSCDSQSSEAHMVPGEPDDAGTAQERITAPVSLRETHRRRAAGMPQTQYLRGVRGHEAAPRRISPDIGGK